MILIKVAAILVLTGLISLIFPKRAHAYIDMGTGSYVFQLILAFIFGGLFGIRLYWKKIKTFFSNLFSKKGGNDEEGN